MQIGTFDCFFFCTSGRAFDLFLCCLLSLYLFALFSQKLSNNLEIEIKCFKVLPCPLLVGKKLQVGATLVGFVVGCWFRLRVYE